MDVINKLATQLSKLWSNASITGRIVTAMAGTLMLLTVVGAAFWSSRPDYKLLRDGISPVLTAEIVSVLTTNGIPNRMNYSGTGVMVPTSQWNQANIAISGLGIPGDGGATKEGNSIFPQNEGHASFVRAKELALERTLESLDAVQSADVHLAMPEPSPFRKNQQPTTASVMIHPTPNQVISPELSMTIIHTVANAVEGLEPKNVSLASSGGELQGTVVNSDPATKRRQYVSDLETTLAMKAQDLLGPVLGPHKSVVRVTVKVDDFIDKVVTAEKIESDAKVRLTERIETSDQKGMPLVTAGPAGVGSNGAGSNAANANGQQVSGKKETNETTYDYPRTEEKTHLVGGNILQLSISAMVDVTRGEEVGTTAAAPDTALLTQAQVEAIIKSAVGFDQKRGDHIDVVLTEFPDLATDIYTAVPDSQKWEFVGQLARNASLGLAAVVALLIGTMTLRKLQPIEISAPAEDQRRRELLSEISTRVDENPEAVSRILAAWLGEEKKNDSGEETIPLKKAA